MCPITCEIFACATTRSIDIFTIIYFVGSKPCKIPGHKRAAAQKWFCIRIICVVYSSQILAKEGERCFWIHNSQCKIPRDFICNARLWWKEKNSIAFPSVPFNAGPTRAHMFHCLAFHWSLKKVEDLLISSQAIVIKLQQGKKRDLLCYISQILLWIISDIIKKKLYNKQSKPTKQKQLI